MKNNTVKKIMCGTFLATVFVALFYDAVDSRKTLREREKKYKIDLETAKKQVTDEVARGIHNDILQAAINKAADRKVDSVLQRAQNDAVNTVKNMIRGEVNSTINTSWSRMKNNIADDLVRRANTFDISDIRKEAVDLAKEKISEAIIGSVDQAVDDFKDRLNDRADSCIDKAEERFEKRTDEALDDLKNRYQAKLWRNSLGL
jgi:hypothetical protein